jgi:hypothetical protein
VKRHYKFNYQWLISLLTSTNYRIDVDAHHGNGTQDILCSTYDPRYLYISLHAGGAEVNGLSRDDDPQHELHDLSGSSKAGGIYPGRCGDTSPHQGVINIPLGPKVRPHEVGTALVMQVTPAVDAFSPDLIILSAGFDAHVNDPMGLGALTAKDFAHITEVVTTLAFKSCSGRLVSVLEGGYGVPCCRAQKPEQFTTQSCVIISSSTDNEKSAAELASATKAEGQRNTVSLNADSAREVAGKQAGVKVRPQPAALLDLGDEIPADMDDQVPLSLQRALDKCHAEGFVDCVREHVAALARCNNPWK